MILTLAGAVLFFAIVAYALYGVNGRTEAQNARLWQMIHDLESDKRALTESLCRAQGKPYIPPTLEKRTLIPSDGWFDGAIRIKVKDDTD